MAIFPVSIFQEFGNISQKYRLINLDIFSKCININQSNPRFVNSLGKRSNLNHRILRQDHE